MKLKGNLLTFQENKKVILFNPENLRWVRMNRDQYRVWSGGDEKAKHFIRSVANRYGLFSQPEDRSKSTSQTIYYSVTGRCNLNCSFCAANSTPETDMGDDLTLSEINELLLPGLRDIAPRKIVITGGEPLMRQDIMDILKLFADYMGRQRITLQSNGLLLTPKSVREISNYVGILEISIENIFASRKLYDQMQEILTTVSKPETGCIKMGLSLSFVADEQSRQYIPQAVDLCHRHGAALTLRTVSMIGRGMSKNQEEKAWDAAEILEMYYIALQRIIRENYFEESMVEGYFRSLQARASCGAFGNMMGIKPDGRIFMCPNFQSHKFCMGNIREQPMHEIMVDLASKISSKEYREIFRVDHQEECRTCDVKSFCTGPCIAEKSEFIDSRKSGKILLKTQYEDPKCLSKKVMLKYSMFYYNKLKSSEENLSVLEELMEKTIREARKKTNGDNYMTTNQEGI